MSSAILGNIVLYIIYAKYCFKFFTHQLLTGWWEGNGNPLQYSCLENLMSRGAWWATVHGVAKSQTQLSNFTFTFHFHALEKEMVTHSSVLAWRIPGTGERGGLPSMGSHRVRHDWSDLAAAVAAASSLPSNTEIKSEHSETAMVNYNSNFFLFNLFYKIETSVLCL